MEPSPLLQGPLLGCQGFKIRTSSGFNHSKSALMFQKAEKMPASHEYFNILRKRNVKTFTVVSGQSLTCLWWVLYFFTFFDTFL